MYCTWLCLSLSLAYATILIIFPAAPGLPFLLPGLILSWWLDFRLARRQPVLLAQRFFLQPVYQEQLVTVTLTLHNPLPYRVRVTLKDEPPFMVTLASKAQGRLILGPRSQANFSYQIIPAQRGRFEFGSLNLRYHGRWYLAAIQQQIPLTESLAVYPDLRKINLDRLARISSEQRHGVGRRFFESAGELTQLREYNPGDDYRRINWKATAHRGKIIINEYEPQKDQTVLLLFDTGRLLYDQAGQTSSRLDRMLDSGILLAYNVLQHRDLVGAVSFNCQVGRYLPVGKGYHHLQLLLEQFFDLQALMVESDYNAVFRFCENKINKRCLWFIYTEISDQESSRELLSHLQMISRRHLVVCVLLRQPALVSALELPLSDEKSAYLKGTALELQAERERLLRSLSTHGIKVLEVDPGNVSQMVVDHYLFLKERGLF